MKNRDSIFVFFLTAAVVWGSFYCSKQKTQDQGTEYTKGMAKMAVQEQKFGQLPDGQKVEIFTLTNASGIKARLMTYGATLVSLEVPDRKGRIADITLGFVLSPSIFPTPPTIPLFRRPYSIRARSTTA